MLCLALHVPVGVSKISDFSQNRFILQPVVICEVVTPSIRSHPSAAWTNVSIGPIISVCPRSVVVEPPKRKKPCYIDQSRIGLILEIPACKPISNRDILNNEQKFSTPDFLFELGSITELQALYRNPVLAPMHV